jgi:hypothetical protein
MGNRSDIRFKATIFAVADKSKSTAVNEVDSLMNEVR